MGETMQVVADARPSRARAVRRVVDKLADEGVTLLSREAAELAKGLTAPQVRVLRATPWDGAYVVCPEATTQALWARGLVYATGKLTRAGVVLGKLLPAELER